MTLSTGLFAVGLGMTLLWTILAFLPPKADLQSQFLVMPFWFFTAAATAKYLGF